MQSHLPPEERALIARESARQAAEDSRARPDDHHLRGIANMTADKAVFAIAQVQKC